MGVQDHSSRAEKLLWLMSLQLAPDSVGPLVVLDFPASWGCVGQWKGLEAHVPASYPQWALDKSGAVGRAELGKCRVRLLPGTGL